MTKSIRKTLFFAIIGLFWIGGPLVGHVGATTGSAGSDITGAIDAAQDDGGTATQFSGLVTTLRGLAVVTLLMLLVGAGMTATWGNTKLAVTVAVGGMFLFGAFWVVTLVAESMGKPDSIPPLSNATVPTDTNSTTNDLVGKPIKKALNEGLNILTSVTLPFILIYGLWLSLAVAAGESDAPVMRGYVIGAVVALSASILGQVFKII